MVPDHGVCHLGGSRVGEVVRHAEEQNTLIQDILLRGVHREIEVEAEVREVAPESRASQYLFEVQHAIIRDLPRGVRRGEGVWMVTCCPRPGS